MKRITIEDVARAAGVSRQTVSRAMNDKGEISPETKERVMRAVQQLGYRPNRLAQGMVTRRTYTVGLVLGNIINPFFPEVTRGVQDVAQANGYNVFLCNTDDRGDIELQELRSLAAQGVDGIILFSHHASDEELRSFADDYRPIVLINRVFSHPHISLLIVDNYRGAQLAAEYLIKHHHTHLGMITDDSSGYLTSRRVSGFKQTILEHELPFSENQIVPAKSNLEGGYQATHRLLDQHPATTAIFAFNDLMAVGAIRSCLERGLRVPEDIAIIGFDDIQFASMTNPSLTTIRVDKYALGQKAMLRVIEMIEDPETNFPRLDMKPELIVRESA